MKKKFIFLLSLFTTALTVAQTNTQSIRGTIVDKQSQSTLLGVNIVVLKYDPFKGATSDMDGKYVITEVMPGRYDIKASMIGYKEIMIPNVLVTSGKQVVIDIEMEENIKTTDEVVVSATKNHETNNEMSTVSSRSFSMEEVNRYSGGMGDPARLASSFAGVVMPNDQRNDLVIRGNSPTGVLWRVDGLNVPN